MVVGGARRRQWQPNANNTCWCDQGQAASSIGGGNNSQQPITPKKSHFRRLRSLSESFSRTGQYCKPPVIIFLWRGFIYSKGAREPQSTTPVERGGGGGGVGPAIILVKFFLGGGYQPPRPHNHTPPPPPVSGGGGGGGGSVPPYFWKKYLGVLEPTLPTPTPTPLHPPPPPPHSPPRIPALLLGVLEPHSPGERKAPSTATRSAPGGRQKHAPKKDRSRRGAD
jgi:hypothetical protein